MAWLAEHREEEALCSSMTTHAPEDGGSIHSPPSPGSLSVCLSLFLPGRHRFRSLCHSYFLHLLALSQSSELQRFVTDALLGALSRNTHNLEELGLQGCTNITDSGLVVLVDGCQRMKYLGINKCNNVGDNGISGISKACSASLKILRMDWCLNVSDSSLNCILSHWLLPVMSILSHCILSYLVDKVIGADTAVWLALLPDQFVTGKFFA